MSASEFVGLTRLIDYFYGKQLAQEFFELNAHNFLNEPNLTLIKERIK